MKKFIFGICFTLIVSVTGGGEDVKPVEVDVLTRTNRSWEGERLPSYERGSPEITILRIKIPPGTSLPMHAHPVINAGVLISGEVTIVTEDNKVLYLKAGESMVEVVNKLHSAKNESNETAEILVFYAGVQSTEITVKE